MKHLIVAVYQETWAWTDKYKPEWEVMIVRKGFDMPNHGREASSYFHGFLRLYDYIADGDFIACVQGNPMDHVSDLGSQLRDKRPELFAWIGDDVYTCDDNGAPHAPGMKLSPWTKRLLDDPGRDSYDFVPGGQFIISGKALLSYPRDFYERMYRAQMDDESTFAPYVFERLWGYLWT